MTNQELIRTETVAIILENTWLTREINTKSGRLSLLIKNGILRKTTEEIEYYHSKLSEHNVLPLEVLTRLDGNKEQEAKDNVVSDTADDIDIDKV